MWILVIAILLIVILAILFIAIATYGDDMD